MNKRDTEIVKDVLLEGNYVFTDEENEADIILYNTCSVREHAEDRVIGRMGQLSKRKLAQRPKSEVLSPKSEDRRPHTNPSDATGQTENRKNSLAHSSWLITHSKSKNKEAKGDSSKLKGENKTKNRKSKDLSTDRQDANRPILGIIGCMATIHKEKLFDKIPGLDLICGPSNIYNLKEDLEQVIKEKKKVKDIKQTDFLDNKYKYHNTRDSSISAWVSIMKGCNNFCSYCVVPYARGREVSRPADDVIDEIKELVDRGFKKVTLLGQNVNSYSPKSNVLRPMSEDPEGTSSYGAGREPHTNPSDATEQAENKKQKTEDRKNNLAHSSKLPPTLNLAYRQAGLRRTSAAESKNQFTKLLERINDETGIRRIRFITNHPKDTSKELFKAMRDLDKVCPHLHLAMQSGSNKILKLMNRGYTYEKFKELVDNLKSIYPECSLTTDIIVGFPGESNEDFMQTYKAIEEIQFDSAFIFKYSPRPRTAALRLKDNVPLKVKKERNQKLLQLQNEICLEKNKKYLNKKIEVLVEEETNKNIYLDIKEKYDKKYIARTPDNKLVFFVGGKELVGEEISVEISKITAHSLVGTQK